MDRDIATLDPTTIMNYCSMSAVRLVASGHSLNGVSGDGEWCGIFFM